MAKRSKSTHKLIESLEERAKELNCLYAVEEILHDTSKGIDSILMNIVKVIPSGMQFPEVCEVKIVYQEFDYTSKKYRETPWFISEDITVQDRVVGWIKVCYLKEKAQADHGPFLKEEKRVLDLHRSADRAFCHVSKITSCF